MRTPIALSKPWPVLLYWVDEILDDWRCNDDEMGSFDDALIEQALLRRLQAARKRFFADNAIRPLGRLKIGDFGDFQEGGMGEDGVTDSIGSSGL